ncbi:bifunctional lytic transglycosylase/C40 family peptidase [Streptomyces sp. WAC01280]|uniref:C40 family peptidase n=1 Tax=Streptomyces sp. WAC01280 TaxID=2487424 RepID=UPI000F78AB34|nr:bifunctional lytic transglycosylase/C40 family peptidase [Streptomyces sp. WAC01280]RSS57494.1 glycoside hydrolase [Streptomyces sp. WAC01280]
MKRRIGCGAVLLSVLAAPVLLVAIVSALPKPAPAPALQTVGKVAGIPQRMLAAYQNAATRLPREVPSCRGMRWPVLAGIARIESNHASDRTITARGDITPRILGPVLDGSGTGGNHTAFPDTDGGRWDGTASSERAVGPFQFLPSTWNGSGRDANDDQATDPHNADDAALGAAVYLCGNGRNLDDRAQLRAAIFQYNHSTAYVDDVLGWIDRYSQLATGTLPIGQPATGDARTVVTAALAQTGIPYSWGGGNASGSTRGICCSPSGKTGTTITGFDCSGLTTYAYAQVGIRLPRTADRQAGIGTRIPASLGPGALQPGDLVFFAYDPSSDSTIHHVGIYLGNGQMINAPRPGTQVRSEPLWDHGFAGGARLL